MAKVKNKILEQLFAELRFAPKRQKEKQLTAAKELVCIVDEAKEYPYEFVCLRITGYQSRTASITEPIAGGELGRDLSVFVNTLSRQLELRADEQAEDVCTIAGLAERFSVSERTINRWQKKGLVGCMYVFADGKKRTGFLKSEVDDFQLSGGQGFGDPAPPSNHHGHDPERYDSAGDIEHELYRIEPDHRPDAPDVGIEDRDRADDESDRILRLRRWRGVPGPRAALRRERDIHVRAAPRRG